MKTIYIPEGQSVSYEDLTIDRLAAGLRSLWLKLTAPWGGGHVVVDADFEPADERESDDGVVGTELYIVHLDAEKEDKPAA